MIKFLYKAIQKINGKIISYFEKLYCFYLLAGNGVHFYNFRTSGIPYIMVAWGGKFCIGKNFVMNNGIKGNPIGCYQRCTFFVDRKGILIIGDNVGISQTAIVCHHSIKIGNNVKIGGGVCIYDTDFHSLDPNLRKSKDDAKHRSIKPVTIGNNAFLGAHSIILKGVSIGENSVIGAGSVVTHSVPPNQIWAGNPAKFIRNISNP